MTLLPAPDNVANPATEYLDSFHCNWKYIQNFLKHNRFDKIVSQKLKKLSQKPVLWQRSKNKTSLINFKWHLLQIRIQKLHCTTAGAVLANRVCFDNQRKVKQAPAVAWSCYYFIMITALQLDLFWFHHNRITMQIYDTQSFSYVLKLRLKNMIK